MEEEENNNFLSLVNEIRSGDYFSYTEKLDKLRNIDYQISLNNILRLYAIKRRDIRAVKLLLDFNADFAKYQGVPPLYTAAKAGFYEGVKLLRQRGATVDQDGENAILASVESGSRECFAAMIEGQEDILLKKIRSRSLSFYAIEMKSNLLPLIATITQKQSEKERGKGNSNEDTEFPPNDLNKNEKKKLKKALELHDCYLPYKEINEEIEKIVSVFTQIPESLPEDKEKLNDEQNKKKSDFLDDLNSSSDEDDKNENKESQKEKADSYLPQIPINSESTKGAYESLPYYENRKRHHKKLERQYSAIEEISVDNNKIPSLSQEQFNKSKSSNQTLQFFDSDDESDKKNKFEFEEEEEVKEYVDYEIEEEEEEKDDEKEDIQYEIEEEEEEVEEELDNNNNNKNGEYDYYEYEN